MHIISPYEGNSKPKVIDLNNLSQVIYLANSSTYITLNIRVLAVYLSYNG